MDHDPFSLTNLGPPCLKKESLHNGGGGEREAKEADGLPWQPAEHKLLASAST